MLSIWRSTVIFLNLFAEWHVLLPDGTSTSQRPRREAVSFSSIQSLSGHQSQVQQSIFRIRAVSGQAWCYATAAVGHC